VRIHTIGIYGFDAASFISTLTAAGVTTVVDIRRRRGVRGCAYRFANATALEDLLRSNDIRYIGERRLSPTQEIRAIQRRSDKISAVSKRAREELDPEFVAAYKAEVLAAYPRRDLDALLEDSGDAPALLCVERTPGACHRHLAAEWIGAQVGAPIVDLLPPPAQRRDISFATEGRPTPV
jgi:uncharacterized protein (DUF488 family)